MSRLSIPATIADAPAASQPLLEGVKKQLGVAPNLFRLVSNSPAALAGYLGLSGALAKGVLSAATRERIAITVAEFNGCDYCLSAHTYIGKNLLKLDDAELTANRSGASNDPKADAAVRFAAKVVRTRGRVSDDDIARRQARRLRRCRRDRDRAECRAQRLDQLLERSGADRDRLPRCATPARPPDDASALPVLGAGTGGGRIRSP